MTESTTGSSTLPKAPPAAAGAPTAGSLLRAARERRGLPIDALAGSVKVAERKLAALEGDRYDELPDLAFTRGLARTLCRRLEIDAEPVLALLPQLPNIGPRLERMHNGLSAPLRLSAGGGGSSGASWRQVGLRPALWLPLLLLLAAAIVWLMPQDWALRARLATGGEAASAPAAGGSAADGTVSEMLPSVVAAAPAESSSAAAVPLPVVPEPAVAAEVASPSVAASAPAPALSSASAAGEGATTGASLLQVSAGGEAWVEVVDAADKTLLRRTLRAGEAVDLDGTPPLRLRIGNAVAVKLRLRGQPVDLPASRSQVIRLELK